MQNIIGLLQLPQANKKYAEGYIMCKDLSLVSKAKGHCRSTNEKKNDERNKSFHHSLCMPRSKVPYSTSYYHVNVTNGDLALTKYPPIC